MNTEIPFFLRAIRFCLFLCCLLLIGFGVGAKRGLLDWLRMKDENRQVQTKLAALDAQKMELETQIRRFDSDKYERERVVRQVLGYIKSNETVIEFE